MIKQNIFIINFNLLYEILNEIKENLPFKVQKYDNEDDFIKDSNLDITNSLIIIKSNHKLLLNKDLSEKNFLDFNIYPIQFNKLRELINSLSIKESLEKGTEMSSKIIQKVGARLN